MKHKKRRGFSLIEAAIVLGIVGLVIGGIWVAAARVMKQQGYVADKELISYAHETAQKLSKASIGAVYTLSPTFLKSVPGNFKWTGSGYSRGSAVFSFEMRSASPTDPSYFRIWYYPNYVNGTLGSDTESCTELVRFIMQQKLGTPPSGGFSLSLYDYDMNNIGAWNSSSAKWDIATIQSSCGPAQVVDIFWGF